MPETLKLSLQEHMKNKVESLDLQLSTYNEQRIEKFIDRGVLRMSFGNVIEQDEKVNLAKRNLEQLIDYMGNMARDQGTHPSLQEHAFNEVMVKSYPLWPYC